MLDVPAVTKILPGLYLERADEITRNSVLESLFFSQQYMYLTIYSSKWL